jgi:lipid II:glycine glycyltransferase (peptidoglycan interpeptide bridge formation enzyme)
MTIRFATPKETDEWNERVLSNPDRGNVFQGKEFAEQKRRGDWIPRFIVAGKVSVTALEKYVFPLGKLWYLPKGPGVTSTKELDDILPSLREFAGDNGVFALKIEPEIIKKEENLADLLKLGLVRVRPIQPNFSTVTLDIHADLDTVMSSLNQKGRHAIKRAERDGVTVKRVDSTDANCHKMYDLLSETAAGSFGIRDFDYYRCYWQRYADAGLGQLFFAYVNGEVVAAAYAIVFGDKSTYKDGASVRERVVYGASHLLQWHVIAWAKSKGAVIHDFCGAPPSDQIKNEKHPHYGIGRFKTSFNKEVTDYIGAFDVPIRPFAYKIWSRIGERVVLRASHKLRHESWY